VTLADILKRLREATEGSHTLDEELAVALGLVPTGPEWKKTAVGTWHKNLRLDESGARYDACFQPGRYTDSLDAAIALVERMLPDRESIKLLEDAGRWFCEIRVYVPCHFVKFTAGEEGCPAPTLALLIALLEALSDKGEPKP